MVELFVARRRYATVRNIAPSPSCSGSCSAGNSVSLYRLMTTSQCVPWYRWRWSFGVSARTNAASRDETRDDTQEALGVLEARRHARELVQP